MSSVHESLNLLRNFGKTENLNKRSISENTNTDLLDNAKVNNHGKKLKFPEKKKLELDSAFNDYQNSDQNIKGHFFADDNH